METQATTSNNFEDDNSEKYILESSKTDSCPNTVNLHNTLLRLNF